MTLTESQQNLMSQALHLAADRYLDFASDWITHPGVKNQFLKQATEARELAMLAEDSETVEFPGVSISAETADRVTKEKFAELCKSLQAESEAKW